MITLKTTRSNLAKTSTGKKRPKKTFQAVRISMVYNDMFGNYFNAEQQWQDTLKREFVYVPGHTA